MTTRIKHSRTGMPGRLVRLQHGEPVVIYDGDGTEYPVGWRTVSVTGSDEYLLPRGGFEHELWVDSLGDCWRRRVIESSWPCEEGKTHTSRPDSPVCWNCGTETDLWSVVEIFVQVAAEGFPAEAPSFPRSRDDVESHSGALLPVGSPEARARAHEQRASAPTPGGGCPMALAFYALVSLALVVAVLAVVHAF